MNTWKTEIQTASTKQEQQTNKTVSNKPYKQKKTYQQQKQSNKQNSKTMTRIKQKRDIKHKNQH